VRFKNMHDSLGHEIGDRVLVAVAQRLRRCLRAEDTLARLGGDEFAILLPEIADRHDTRPVTDKCLSALSAYEEIDGHELSVNASIGVAVYRWVLTEACRQACRWPTPLVVSVNVSAGRLRRGNLYDDTAAILTETGLKPNRLVLELSERILFDEVPDALSSLADFTSDG